MVDLYVELSGRDDIDGLDLSKPIVAATSDIEVLLGWYAMLSDKQLEISEFIAAYRHAEIDDESYFKRTGGMLGFVSIALRWVEHRLLELDVTPPYRRTDPRSRQLRILNEAVNRMKAEIAALKAGADAPVAVQ